MSDDYQPWQPPTEPTAPQPAPSPAPASPYSSWSAFPADPSVAATVTNAPNKSKGLGFFRWLSVVAVSALIGAAVGAFVVNDNDNGTTSTKAASSLTASKTTTTLSKNAAVTATQAATPTSIRGVLQKVQPAVVTIDVQDSQGEASGTGMIITADGEILTNGHVVEGATSITVTLDGAKQSQPAKLLGIDTSIDTAVIKLSNVSDLPTVEFGDSASAQVGDQVVAIGYPLALAGGPSVTTGIVSAEDRSLPEETGVTLDGLIQTDAAINSGNSGGPLANMEGQIIGMNTAVIRGDSGEYQNIGFSLPINTIKAAIPDIASGQVKQAGYLGVNPVTLTAAIKDQYNLTPDQGAVIDTVAASSPADQAGLSRFDVVTQFDGKDVASADDLVGLVRAHHAGDKVSLTYYRGTAKKTVTVTLAARAATSG